MSDQEKLVELIKLIDEHYQISYHRQAGEIVGILNTDELAANLIANGVTVKKMQKPLTVVEATGTVDVVWFEQKHLGATYPCDAVIASDCVNVNMSMIGHRVPLVRTIKGYGKTWRCWAEKPTGEERKAAEWEK